MAEIVYRLSTDYQLPRHWAYGEAWDLSDPDDTGERKLLDLREAGFQVWSTFSQVIAGSIRHCDGNYRPEQYPLLLVITVDGPLNDGCGEWYAVDPDDVRSVRSVPVKSVYSWLRSVAGNEVLNEDDEDEIERDLVQIWLEEHQNEAAAWLESNLKGEPIEFEETLPCPKCWADYCVED